MNSPTTGVALVTGASRGIGAAVASAFAAAGVPVALLDRDDSVRAVADSLGAAPVPTMGLVADVTDAGAVRAAVDRVENELGPITALANVAGVLRTGRVLDAADADWHACLDVNATGVWNVTRAVGARMVERRAGSIVTVASNAAGVPRAGMAAYAASKAAAVALTRVLGLELAPHVRCNIVCPGSTDTDMLRASFSDGYGLGEVLAGDPGSYRLGIPLDRVAVSDDIADAVLFLAGDGARHITMQALVVDGGATLGA
ncbi:MAG: SDR family NAD(P)-dependent oxidoreductase [Pseudonocardia sp.]|nr:SDR family NAD(P)-dependent oxidoreductase [Pseudonocardia sp.]